MSTSTTKPEDAPKGALPDAPVGYENLKDSMGRFRTQSLFVEHKHDSYPAPFTLKEYNHRGAMSMYLKYMEYSDPTEYSVAIGLLGSWRHWKQLTSADWFEPYITQWRAELKNKLEYERFKEMHDLATRGNTRASIWLDDKYGTRKKPKRGRPSKHEKNKLLKEEAEDAALLKEEQERLGL
jgi:hypothetical protein